LSLRCVADSHDVFEDGVGLAQVENTSSSSIYTTLKDCLLHLGIPFYKYRGQAYDRAKKIQGKVNGVAKKTTLQLYLYTVWHIA